MKDMTDMTDMTDMKNQAQVLLALVNRLDGLDGDQDWGDSIDVFWEIRDYLDDQSLRSLFNESKRLEWCVYARQAFPSDIEAIRSGLKDLIANMICPVTEATEQN